MTINILDSRLTIKTGEDGVTTYSHPEATTILTSDYRVFNSKNGRELKVYQNDNLIGGQISSKFKGKRSNFSFPRLLALMAGQPDSGYYRLIDKSKPLTLDNITTLKDHMKNSTIDLYLDDKGYVSSQKPKVFISTDYKSTSDMKENFDILIKQDTIKEYLLSYIPCDDNVRFKTEDGLVFIDRAEALMHQMSVDKGKELAEMVLLDKAGYALAEKMYFTQVNYAQGKPLDYNFITVLENNTGITEIGDQTYLVEEDKTGVHQFEDKDEMTKWLKAKALVDLIVDYRYNVARIANIIE